MFRKPTIGTSKLTIIPWYFQRNWCKYISLRVRVPNHAKQSLFSTSKEVSQCWLFLSSPSLHRQNGCLCCVTGCGTLSLNWSTIGCWIHLPSGQIQQLIRPFQNCQVNQSTLVTSDLIMHANLHEKGETGGTHTQDSDFTQNEHASRTDSVELCQ